MADSRSPQPLDGKVALVTGASRGIGAAVARGFCVAGAAVVLAARDQAALDQLATELVESGARAIAVPTDVTDAGALASLVERAVSEFGRLDIACNNAAGGGHPPTPLADVAIEAFDSAFAVNLRGVFLAMKYEISAMLASGGGAIVNMSSTAGSQAVAGLAAYVATKHGLEGAHQGCRARLCERRHSHQRHRPRADPHRPSGQSRAGGPAGGRRGHAHAPGRPTR